MGMVTLTGLRFSNISGRPEVKGNSNLGVYHHCLNPSLIPKGVVLAVFSFSAGCHVQLNCTSWQLIIGLLTRSNLIPSASMAKLLQRLSAVAITSAETFQG